MAREQTHTQNQKGRNPAALPADDDENLAADRSSIDDEPETQGQEAQQAGLRQAQGQGQDDLRRRPEENIEQVEDEEAEDDEDESDGISQRP